jgi:sugar phosphate permease
LETSSLKKRLSNLYYGWRMVGLVSALRVLGGGLHNYGFTVFFLPVTQELALSRASTSLAFSLARAQGSFLSPIVGHLVDRHGPKPMMFTASLLAGVGYILFSYVDSYTTFLVVYLGVISISFTAGFVHAPTIVANSWFIRLRARAMTVVSAAVPVGGAIITPLLALAVSHWGWRWAAFMSGTLFLVVGLPLCLGVRRSPESMGMQPDGEPVQLTLKSDGGTARQTEPHKEPDISVRQAMRTRIFWMLVVSMMARSAAFTTVTTHFIPIMVWKGLSETQASVLLAGFAIFNLPLHFMLGWIGDFVNKPKLTAICMLLGVVAVLPMLWSNATWALWFFSPLLCAGRFDSGLLGIGWRLLWTQIIRHDSRHDESLLHLGQHPRSGHCRRDLRSDSQLCHGNDRNNRSVDDRGYFYSDPYQSVGNYSATVGRSCRHCLKSI